MASYHVVAGGGHNLTPDEIDPTLDAWLDTHAGLGAKPWTVTARVAHAVLSSPSSRA